MYEHMEEMKMIRVNNFFPSVLCISYCQKASKYHVGACVVRVVLNVYRNDHQNESDIMRKHDRTKKHNIRVSSSRVLSLVAVLHAILLYPFITDYSLNASSFPGIITFEH